MVTRAFQVALEAMRGADGRELLHLINEIAAEISLNWEADAAAMAEVCSIWGDDTVSFDRAKQICRDYIENH